MRFPSRLESASASIPQSGTGIEDNVYHFRGLSFRHNRPRHSAKPGYDPQARAKMNAMTEVLGSPIAGNHIIGEAKSYAHMLPTLGSMWKLHRKQVQLPTPGTNQRKSVFGPIDIRTGAFMHLIFDRKRAIEFIEFLEHIVFHYPTGKIDIVLANFSVHETRGFQECFARHPRVRLYSLRCYMLQLSPVEKGWWHMKVYVTVNKLYGSAAALIDAINAFS